MTHLAKYIAANGSQIVIRGRTFTVGSQGEDEGIAVATFNTARTSYRGVICINARVPGKLGAEVWAIVGGRKTQATFAIHEGAISALS